jgi:sporulation protein YlmC with PRC-barrel domain
LEERGLVGLEARAADGTEMGRISDVIIDEESGEVTHVLVEQENGDELDVLEIPISALILDPEADFATFHADPSDEEPGDHLGDDERPPGYAPAESDAPDDSEHEGQFVTTPPDPAEAKPPEDRVKESGEAGDWEDEAYTPDSGYPRNDAYVDPETGEDEVDPLIEENETLEDDVEDLLADTNLEVRSAKDGIVELSGAAATQEDLDEIVREIMGLDGVLEVDTTDVDVG